VALDRFSVGLCVDEHEGVGVAEFAHRVDHRAAIEARTFEEFGQDVEHGEELGLG